MFAGSLSVLHRILSQRSSSRFNSFSPVTNIWIIRTGDITIKPPQNIVSLLNTTLHNITRIFTRIPTTFPTECGTSLKMNDITRIAPCATTMRAKRCALLRRLAAISADDSDVTGRAALRTHVAWPSAAVADGIGRAGER